MIDRACVDFCVDYLSSEEIDAQGWKWGGDWSGRCKPGMPECGIKENAKALNRKRKKPEGRGLMISGFAFERYRFLKFTESDMKEI